MELGTLLLPKKFWQFKIDDKLVYECEANSWVRNLTMSFYWCLLATYSPSGDIIDINGMERTAASTIAMQISASAGITTYGIVIGSSNQAFSYTDYKLISQITNIVHQACNIQLIDNDTKILIDRNFYNTTGSSVTIREVGIYGRNASFDYDYCIERTVLSNAITLNNGQLLTVSFTLSFT